MSTKTSTKSKAKPKKHKVLLLFSGGLDSRLALKTLQEQKNYQSRVQDALKQLMDIKKNKQRIKR